jgi:hypothetical protein
VPHGFAFLCGEVNQEMRGGKAIIDVDGVQIRIHGTKLQKMRIAAADFAAAMRVYRRFG